MDLKLAKPTVFLATTNAEAARKSSGSKTRTEMSCLCQSGHDPSHCRAALDLLTNRVGQ